jgi:hypothetical protein
MADVRRGAAVGWTAGRLPSGRDRSVAVIHSEPALPRRCARTLCVWPSAPESDRTVRAQRDGRTVAAADASSAAGLASRVRRASTTAAMNVAEPATWRRTLGLSVSLRLGAGGELGAAATVTRPARASQPSSIARVKRMRRPSFRHGSRPARTASWIQLDRTANSPAAPEAFSSGWSSARWSGSGEGREGHASVGGGGAGLTQLRGRREQSGIRSARPDVRRGARWGLVAIGAEVLFLTRKTIELPSATCTPVARSQLMSGRSRPSTRARRSGADGLDSPSVTTPGTTRCRWPAG